MQEPHGLFLVVGPAGNGKSTTLASMINHCNNTRRRHILTIEDPIEFIFKDKKSVITQREVPFDTPTFRAGLDNALRADADIPYDRRKCGENCHHADSHRPRPRWGIWYSQRYTPTNATGVVHRIVDSFPPEQQSQIAHQLAGSLLGVCSIRLLPRISGGLVPACEILFNTGASANLIRGKSVWRVCSQSLRRGERRE